MNADTIVVISKALSSWDPVTSLSFEQNLSIWLEQNKHSLKELSETLSEEERESFQNVSAFMENVDINHIKWALSWPEGQAWRISEDKDIPNWNVTATFVAMFQWLEKHSNVDDPYIQFLYPNIKEESEKNPAVLNKLKQIGFTFQEIVILVQYFWNKSRLKQLQEEESNKDKSDIQVN